MQSVGKAAPVELEQRRTTVLDMGRFRPERVCFVDEADRVVLALDVRHADRLFDELAVRGWTVER
jgi:hypothetical protein